MTECFLTCHMTHPPFFDLEAFHQFFVCFVFVEHAQRWSMRKYQVLATALSPWLRMWKNIRFEKTCLSGDHLQRATFYLRHVPHTVANTLNRTALKPSSHTPLAFHSPFLSFMVNVGRYSLNLFQKGFCFFCLFFRLAACILGSVAWSCTLTLRTTALPRQLCLRSAKVCCSDFPRSSHI